MRLKAFFKAPTDLRNHGRAEFVIWKMACFYLTHEIFIKLEREVYKAGFHIFEILYTNPWACAVFSGMEH